MTAAPALRGAITAVFTAIAAGRSPARPDLDRLRDHYAEAIAAARLDLGSAPARWSWDLGGDLRAPLWPIAASAVELLTGPRLARVKECDGERCWVLFVDGTRNGARRWCLMRYCGNAVKSRAQAARRRAARAGSTRARSR